MTQNSTPKTPHAAAPVGFITGVLAGMAAYYLTHSEKGTQLRDRLVSIYDQYRADQDLDRLKSPSNSAPTPPSLVETLDSPLVLKQSRYAASLLKRVKVKIAQKDALNQAISTPPPKSSGKKASPSSHHFFTQKDH